MGRWLVGGGVKKRGGNEVISNGSYLREDVGCGMEFGVWSLDAFLLVCYSKALSAWWMRYLSQ